MIDLIVRDGFASAETIAAALAEWPTDGWHEYGPHKRATVPGVGLPPPIASLLYRLARLPLPYTPDLGLWGAGLHEMPPGPGLGWHTDADRHAVLGLKRSRSSVLYLCGDGDIEFRSGAIVRPAPGRLVVFDGSEPHRVLPVTKLRRSVSLFWYSAPAFAGSTRAEFEGVP